MLPVVGVLLARGLAGTPGASTGAGSFSFRVALTPNASTTVA